MNGAHLFDRVRRILKDIDTDIQQGSFWSDREIEVALNAAQSVFCNHCIDKNQYWHLKRLLRNTGYITSPNIVPANYLHYSAALVGSDENNLKLGRIYIGGEGHNYMYVKHKAIAILKDTLYIIDNANYNINGLPSGSGILFYYEYPSAINSNVAVLNNYNLDFDLWIYEDVFVYYASVLCGMKETQTQRDTKTMTRVLTQLLTYPDDITNYKKMYDASQEVLYAQRQKYQAQLPTGQQNG